MRRLAIFAASLSLLACGGTPKEGDKCDSNGFLCADATAALECRLGAWVKLPCRGTGGCARAADVIKCDMSANVENDNCASTALGRGLCASDMKSTLECRAQTSGENKLVKSNTCRTCTVSGDQVNCTP